MPGCRAAPDMGDATRRHDPARSVFAMAVSPGRGKDPVTTVALLPGAGMLRKYRGRRVSRPKFFREIRMPFAKQLPPARSSSPTRLPRRTGYAGPDRPANKDNASLSEDTARRMIPVAVSRLMVGTIAQLTQHTGAALSNLPLTILSWLFAEFVAGCAAYAEAMHPYHPIVDDDVEPGDRGLLPRRDDSRPSPRPSLTVISGNAARPPARSEPVRLLQPVRPRPEPEVALAGRPKRRWWALSGVHALIVDLRPGRAKRE